MDQAQVKQRGYDLFRKMLGPEQTEQMKRCWADIAPDLEEYIVRFVAGEIWSRPALDLRSKSLVTVATLATLGRTLALDLNIRMALRNGASRQDLLETFLQIAPYAGFPACWEGLAMARKIFDELDAAKPKT